MFVSSISAIETAKIFHLSGEIPTFTNFDLDTSSGSVERSSKLTKDGLVIKNAIQLFQLTTNLPMVVKVRKLGWNLPRNYPKGKGKRKNGSDFLLKITETDLEGGEYAICRKI